MVQVGEYYSCVDARGLSFVEVKRIEAGVITVRTVGSGKYKFLPITRFDVKRGGYMLSNKRMAEEYVNKKKKEKEASHG